MIDQLPVIVLRTTSFLAAPPTPPPGKGAEWGKAAPIGLLVILLLCVAVWLLLRSMSKHLRKVQGFGEQEQAPQDGVAGLADESAAAAGPDRPGTATVGALEDPGSPVVGTPAAADPPP